jgi:hypothetical protein
MEERGTQITPQGTVHSKLSITLRIRGTKGLAWEAAKKENKEQKERKAERRERGREEGRGEKKLKREKLKKRKERSQKLWSPCGEIDLKSPAAR